MAAAAAAAFIVLSSCEEAALLVQVCLCDSLHVCTCPRFYHTGLRHETCTRLDMQMGHDGHHSTLCSGLRCVLVAGLTGSCASDTFHTPVLSPSHLCLAHVSRAPSRRKPKFVVNASGPTPSGRVVLKPASVTCSK